MQKLIEFIKDYKHFSAVALVALVSLALELLGKANIAHILLAVAAGVSVLPILKDIWDSLRQGEYGVDILAATAIATSVAMGEYWAGIVIVVMLTGGEALEDYSEKRAKRELTALIERAPKKAHLVAKNGKVSDVLIDKVKIGDKLLLKPGEVVPVDGIVVEGTSSFDESGLTGESLPVVREVGGQLLSGSINLDASVTIKATQIAKDSQYEQIIRMVKAASSAQAPFVRLADRYSIPFTIIAFVIAFGAWAVSGQSIRFLEVLVVATPCPLILGAPIALTSGMSRAAKHGIIVRTGGALERLAQARTVAFDKTGTLTKGLLGVDKIKTYGKNSSADTLLFAAALAQNSPHILSHAIVEESVKQKLHLPKIKTVNESAGQGLSGVVKGREVLLGRLKFLQDKGVKLPASFKADKLTQTVSCVAIDGHLAGVISFKDEVREETKETLEHLKLMGIEHLLLVTGDNKATANEVAKKLGITDVVSECLPGDKILAIEKAKAKPVAFVGDGVNDAPVLTASDVGIALGARGSTAASESADVVIMQDDLSRVAEGVAIAKRTFFIAKQSIMIGIGISIALMFIFSTGRFRPVYGAAIQELVDVTVIINALRAHSSKRK